jgi:hypothetical protein
MWICRGCRRQSRNYLDVLKEGLAGHKWSECEAELLTNKKKRRVDEEQMAYVEKIEEKLQNNINTEEKFVPLEIITEKEDPPILTNPIVEKKTSAVSDETVVDKFNGTSAGSREENKSYKRRDPLAEHSEHEKKALTSNGKEERNKGKRERITLDDEN